MNVVDYVAAAGFLFNKFPSHVILSVTGRCNARCNHCFYWKQLQGAREEEELTLDEIRKISENLRHIKLLSITGGEPTLREDVPEIVRTFYENNCLHHVVLHTNGLLPEKARDIATKIAKENPRLELNLAVSVDSLGKKHDRIRGVEGGFEKAKRTVELVAREKRHFRNLHVTVNTCFTHFNQDDARDTADFFYRSFDIDGYSVALVRGAVPDGRAKDIDVDKYRDFVSHLNKADFVRRYYRDYPLASFMRALDFLVPQVVMGTLTQKKRLYPCKAGQSLVVISEKGRVSPCEMLDMPFGNVREHDYDMRKLLFSERGKAIVSSIKRGDCHCTWECAIANNIIFNWKAYPRLLSAWLRLQLGKVFGE